MFEDLKAQRTQGLGPRERRRLLTTVSVTLILGAVIVFAFGAARILQLRMVAGRARRKGPVSAPPPTRK